MVSVHYFEYWRYFVSSKTFCALGLGLELGLGFAEIIFGQTCFRASVVDPPKVGLFTMTSQWSKENKDGGFNSFS